MRQQPVKFVDNDARIVLAVLRGETSIAAGGHACDVDRELA